MNETDLSRFLSKVQIAESGCWIWTGALNNRYGSFWLTGNQMLAHVVSCTHFNGPIPLGYEVDHLCFVRACVNPKHLEAVTPEENRRRYFVKADKTPNKRIHQKERVPKKERIPKIKKSSAEYQRTKYHTDPVFRAKCIANAKFQMAKRRKAKSNF